MGGLAQNDLNNEEAEGSFDTYPAPQDLFCAVSLIVCPSFRTFRPDHGEEERARSSGE